MQKMIFYLFLFLSVLVFGCIQKKLSSEELMSALKSAGYSVEKEGKIHHSLEGAQKALWVKIDASRIAAYQYSTLSEARIKARSFQDGLCVGFWAFEFVDPQTAEKIKKALN